MIRWLLPACWLALAGCTTLPAEAPPVHSARAEFAIEGRFALRVDNAAEGGQVSGRLTWTHGKATDHFLLANPFGQGMAELHSGPEGAWLQLANGERRSAASATELLAAVLGVDLPVHRLAGWLTGADDGAAMQRDASGRPKRLRQDGWQIDYDYSDTAAPLADRITVLRPGEYELRLRIEAWQ